MCDLVIAIKMTPPEHPMFLGFFDYEWSAIGSLATAVAAVVALLLPVALDMRSRQREGRREAAQIQNIVDSSYIGLSTLANGLASWCEDDPVGLHRHLAWSIGVARRLDIYSRSGTLPDVVIDCGISVSAALGLFHDVLRSHLQDGFAGVRTADLHVATTIAIHAMTRLAALCDERRLESRHRRGAEEKMARAIDLMNDVPLSALAATNADE
ncbi:MAG: hypothetical protein EON55_03750 [Alphaproteobacteria bacterium]|nr:MAG: hypothetical protein EON55_03750 [Alphaproteobacteria bacterium]